MARTLRDSKLDTREARLRLKIQTKPFWRLIEPGLHLGYRRLAGRAGSWCVRRYVGSQTYAVQAINAVADDYREANGDDVLNFKQAQRRALEHKPKAAAGALTVKDALDQYLADLEHRHRPTQDTRYRVDGLIAPELSAVPVQALSAEQLRAWHAALARSPGRYTQKGDQGEARRRRQASANRTLTILRAALNLAYREGKVSSDAQWRRVRPFKGVEQPRLRFLDADECRRLINAAQGAFRNLVLAALHSGCRYGELAILTVGDFHSDSGTLLIRTSKSSKARRVWLTDEAQRLFTSWCAGRRGNELLLRKRNGTPWRKSDQTKEMREACERAGIIPATGFHTLRHTHASHLAMRGTPLAVIAEQLGHADQRMTQRYSHLGASYVGDTIRENALRLGAEPDEILVPLAQRT